MEKRSVLRNVLALTQAQLAGLLGVSRARLGMFELGKRSLPESALNRLRQLEAAHSSSTHNLLPAVAENKVVASANLEEILGYLDKSARECRRRAAKLEKQLEQARKYYDQLGSLASITAAVGVVNMSAADSKWVEIMEFGAGLEAVNCGPHAQFILQHRINILLATAVAHEAALDEFRSGRFKKEM